MWKLAAVLVFFSTIAYAEGPPPPTAAGIWTCDASEAGQTAYVTGGTDGLAWGATLTSGGTSNYFVRCNGVNWTVVGK